MAVINRERFEPIKESGSSRRYFDTWTGETVSRRFATEASTNLKIEERQESLRRALVEIDPDYRRIKSPAQVLEYYFHDKGITVRGPNTPEFYKDLKQALKETPRNEWAHTLYEYAPKEFWKGFDWKAFFGSPE